MKYNLTLDTQPTGGQEPSQFRQVLPQVLACTAKSTLYLSLGMFVGLPTLLIPDLTDPKTIGHLHFTSDEASWYGSLSYIFQPLGSLTSGALLQSMGCRKLMIYVNIPQFVSWILTYYAASNLILYVSSALFGLVLGLMESPTIRYISEISHPCYRGILTTYSTGFITVGFLVVYGLGSVMHWRSVALISASTPIISIIVLFMIPETPIWLMSKGRPEEALKSLQWLRGWTSAEVVKKEFAELQFYAKKRPEKTLHAYGKAVNTRDEGPAVNVSSVGPVNGTAYGDLNGGVQTDIEVGEYERRGLREKWDDLSRREMLVPLAKCIILLFVSICSGLMALRPFYVEVFDTFQLPTDANATTVLTSVIAIFGNIACMVMINRVKKKPLIIFSLVTAGICLIFLALFDLRPASPGNDASLHWWSLALFSIIFFVNNLGIYPMSWTILSEILPYRGRGIATAVGSSAFYLVLAFGVKMYPTLEEGIGLYGIFLLCALVSFGGAYFSYFAFPETEGRFLSDIETEITHADQTDRNKTQNTAL